MDHIYGAGKSFGSLIRPHLILDLSHRSVHNVRIERLWVDVTAQIGAAWSAAFTALELHHGLDINNVYHLWLLHHLFLPILNQHLSFFAEAWNHHRIQIRNGPNRSPADMFGFDMLVHGVRGDRLYDADTNLTADELEVYGVDWAALNDDHIVQSVRSSAPQSEGATSWIGRAGPPDHLNEVPLFPPATPYTDGPGDFDARMAVWMQTAGDISISAIWIYGIALSRSIYGGIF